MSQAALLRSRERLLERAQRFEPIDAEKTLCLVERVLHWFPTDIDALLIQARVWIRLGRTEAAHRQLEQLVEHAPDRIDVRLSWIGLLFCFGRYSEAVDPLVATVALCERDRPVMDETSERQLRSLWRSYREFPQR